MGGWLRDKEHLARMAGLLVAGVLAFLVLRSLAVPAGFGEHGHFRARALEDNAARPLVFAGHETCEECHGDVVDARRGSKHAKIHCEICHGPAADHAEDPSSRAPVLPDGRGSCLVCHSANPARPAWMSPIDAEEHVGEEACTTCHAHHHPEIEGD